MNDKQKRLNEVYAHLKKHFGIHNQTDFADAIERSRSVISSALNGNEDNLTDKLFKHICSVYEGVFNVDYLLKGEGELLTIEEQVKIGEIEERRAGHPVGIPDYVQKMCDEAVRISQKCESLEQQLALSLADNRELKERLNLAITSIDGMKNQLSQVLQFYHGPASSYGDNHYQPTVNER
jgi:hypothetical protein